GAGRCSYPGYRLCRLRGYREPGYLPGRERDRLCGACAQCATTKFKLSFLCNGGDIKMATKSGSRSVARNRSVPTDTVLPHIIYQNVAEALAWLATTFGFVEHY